MKRIISRTLTGAFLIVLIIIKFTTLHAAPVELSQENFEYHSCNGKALITYEDGTLEFNFENTGNLECAVANLNKALLNHDNLKIKVDYRNFIYSTDKCAFSLEVSLAINANEGIGIARVSHPESGDVYNVWLH